MADRDETPPDVIRPSLQQVRLVAVTADSSLGGAPRELTLQLASSVDLDLRAPEHDNLLRAAVVVSLKATASESEEAPPLAKVEARYEGEFVFAEGVSAEQVQDDFTRHAYQRELVYQAFPVAFAMFRDQLGAMGLLAGGLPLAPP